jgi:hypothetical protein
MDREEARQRRGEEMKTYRTSRGPFNERPFFSDAEIEAICVDELRQQKLLPASPAAIRIERFVEKRFKVNVETANLPEGFLGVTKFGTSGVLGVFVSEALDSDKSVPATRRLRSTIAHEAGHGLLHAHLFAIPSAVPLFGDATDDPTAPRVLCRGDRVDGSRQNYAGEWWEFQANIAMGHLLMPRPLVEKAAESFLVPVGNLGAKILDPSKFELVVRSMSDIFDVNPVVARIRLESLYSPEHDHQMSL